MGTAMLHPASAATVDDARQRTVKALESILTRLGDAQFATDYLEDFAHYVFTGELPPKLVALKNAGDETYLKVIRVVSKAQAEAIAETVPEARPRSKWLGRLMAQRSYLLSRIRGIQKSRRNFETDEPADEPAEGRAR
jgi:hypothetical protein